MDVHKIAVIQTSLGGFDQPIEHIEQTLPADYFRFTDENFPPRHRSLQPRLQAKIPKMFAWQLKPNYEYYLWLDGNLTLNNQNALQFFLNEIQGYDIVLFRHHRRPNIRQENRYLRKGLREQSMYLVSRYDSEFLKEQIAEIEADKDFVDDLLVMGGTFFYRNTPAIQAMLKEWWYHVSRYIIQDQLAFPYVLKKSGIKLKVLDIDLYHWDLIKVNNHAKRYQ